MCPTIGFTMNRKNREGGKGAIHVDKTLRCNIIEGLIYSMDNILECLTIEMHKKKNII